MKFMHLTALTLFLSVFTCCGTSEKREQVIVEPYKLPVEGGIRIHGDVQ